ncbi:MAG: SAM-dependent methyltransferase [Actinomycetota bacterium]
MTVARFMEIALYHPEFGYYATGPPRTGWRGHFLTSAEIDGAFGELWACGFEEIWQSCGRPGRFEIVEIGPGEGGFAAAVLTAASGDFGRALTYRLVEPRGALRARQSARLEDVAAVSWSTTIDHVPYIDWGCVFANEVLDNLPVRLVERGEAGVQEVVVVVDGGELRTRAVAAAPDLVDWLVRTGVHLPPGGRAEIPTGADALVAAAAARLRTGALVVCDYGLTAGEASSRAIGTLACYSDRGVDDDFLADPGTKDITSHVNWTAVAHALDGQHLEVTDVLPQRTVLKRLGIDALHDELRERARAGGVGALRALSRRQALGILADPGGLGALGVIAGVRGVPVPGFLRGSP